MPHPNAGKPWTPQERMDLREAFYAGASITELVAAHGRTPNAVVSQLAVQGCLVVRHKAFFRVEATPFATFGEITKLTKEL